MGAMLMANEPRPNVEDSIRSGSGGTLAVRLWEPLTVAFAESVMVCVELDTLEIVVPAGMPVPVMLSPAASPDMLLIPVTYADPLDSVPVKTRIGVLAVRRVEPLAVGYAESVMVCVELDTLRIVVPAGMPVPVTVWPTASPVMLLIPVTDSEVVESIPVKTKVWYGPARLGMPVLRSMLPSDRLRDETGTWGRLPPWASAPKVVLGKSDHVRPSSIDWYTPELPATYST